MEIAGAQRLEVKALVKYFRSKKVVRGVSLSVKKGEVVGLLGPNGAGKTTTFKMIVGLIIPDEGKIYLDSQDITQMPMYKRARKGLGYLPQETSVFKKMSVEENLSTIIEAQAIERSRKKTRIEEVIQELALTDVRRQKAETLSGGEKRRLEIARALLTEPSFILLDEPFAGIDPKAVIVIQDIVAHLKQKGIGIIITDHNVRETLTITDRAYIIYEGQVLREGTSSELIKDEKTKEIYLGERFRL